MMNYELLKDKKFIITGGMGFIGSSLAIGLEQLGANVTILGAMIPDYGGNEFNISLLTNKVRQNFCDIRDAIPTTFLELVKTVIHLAERGSWILLNFRRNAKPKNQESSIRMSQNLRA